MTAAQGDRAAAEAIELMTFVDGLGWVVKCADAQRWLKLYEKSARELVKIKDDTLEWGESQ